MRPQKIYIEKHKSIFTNKMCYQAIYADGVFKGRNIGVLAQKTIKNLKDGIVALEKGTGLAFKMVEYKI